MQASRTFTSDDQERFASLSGDFNPIHLDELIARRTLAGAPIVHGVHLLLWGLGILASHWNGASPVGALNYRFRNRAYLGDRIDAHIEHRSGNCIRCKAVVGALEVLALDLMPADPSGRRIGTALGADTPQALRSCASELALEDIPGRAGTLPFANRPRQYAEAFPHAAELLGAPRVAALGCSSYLVGMVVPGLNSLYNDAHWHVHTDDQAIEALRYRVVALDPRFRRVQIDVAGPGLSGSLTAVSPPPPVQQPSMSVLAARVAAGEFSSQSALIVGGSRGLGEVTAKLIAAGGGSVCISYARGESDARAVAAEITRAGGRCEVIAYDVERDARAQLPEQAGGYTHIYYFATPAIAPQSSWLSAVDRLREFNRFYLHGFRELVTAAKGLWPHGFGVFYPSSIYVQQHPPGMSVYAQSKTAGEALCAELTRDFPQIKILVERLPRLLTDQSAAVVPQDAGDPVPPLLAAIRRMQAS
jgi:NADP-dependent 3-hydroxy acid dehydrogenase YdfG